MTEGDESAHSVDLVGFMASNHSVCILQSTHRHTRAMEPREPGCIENPILCMARLMGMPPQAQYRRAPTAEPVIHRQPASVETTALQQQITRLSEELVQKDRLVLEATARIDAKARLAGELEEKLVKATQQKVELMTELDSQRQAVIEREKMVVDLRERLHVLDADGSARVDEMQRAESRAIEAEAECRRLRETLAEQQGRDDPFRSAVDWEK